MTPQTPPALDLGRKLRLMSIVPTFVQRAVMTRYYRKEIDQVGEPELPFLRDIVKRGELALDIGANLGTYSYELARLTGNVIAFEPNPALAHLLRRVKIKGVVVEEAAVAEASGRADLMMPRLRSGHVLSSLKKAVIENIGGGMDTVNVRIVRIDDLDLPKVGFIKVDVEGFEEEVFAGARHLIARDAPVVLAEIEERHNAGGVARIYAFFGERGYSAFFLRNGAWTAMADIDLARDQDYATAHRPGVTARTVAYCNNFVFFPPGADTGFMHSKSLH